MNNTDKFGEYIRDTSGGYCNACGHYSEVIIYRTDLRAEYGLCCDAQGDEQ